MIKSVLVTGANGFIGSHLIELLVQAKFQINILVRRESNLDRLKEYLSEVSIFYIEDGIETVITQSKPDVVLHLATKYLKSHSTTQEAEEMIDVNIKFPTLICENLIKQGVKYFINTGTCFEFKSTTKPLTEKSSIQPYNFYAATKVSFSKILEYYASQNQLNVIDLKLFFPFGEKDNEKVIPFLVKTLIEGNEIDFNKGEQEINFTYVKDICLAYLQAIKYLDQHQGYESFNIGYNKTFTLKAVAKQLEEISGLKFKINWGSRPYNPNEIFHTNCDNQMAVQKLGWSPKYNFKEGLKLTYNYYQNIYKNEQ